MDVSMAKGRKNLKFAIAYPDDCGMYYIDERGELMNEIPEGMPVIQANSIQQAKTWIDLYVSMPDSFIVGEQPDVIPVMKLTDNLAIAI